MKLLFVHERLGFMGGAEANLLLAARELKARGHSLALLHGPSTGRGETAWQDVFPQRFPLNGPRSGHATRSCLEILKPDLIYLHKMGDLAVVESLIGSRVPLVRMVHDHDLYCMRGYKYHPISRSVCSRPLSPYCIFPCGATVARNREKGFPVKWVSYARKKRELRLNQKCDRLIVATNYMRGELVQNGFEEERIAVHAPVPQGLTEQPEHSSLSERNTILYAGQIIRGKGVDVLLEALAKVQTPFECLVAGEGNHRAECERLSHQLGLQNRVRFLGFVPREELRVYYLQASLLAVSSVWPEPFGAVGVEAMRFGLPVVAFDAGGIREWLADGYNGFLVPWMDREAFARRVEQLLSDKKLASQMGKRGASLARQRFDFSDYVTALESTFARVLSEKETRVHA